MLGFWAQHVDMVEIKQTRSAEETIERRQRNSGGVEADKMMTTLDDKDRPVVSLLN